MDVDFAATAKPFQFVIFCCTGVDQEQRTTIVNKAQQMGAIYIPDLRSDVTHMIVGDVTTPKYQFAAQRRFDLKIMDMNWVTQAYDKWIQGEDVNFEQSVEIHLLPPLYGLHICLTNIPSQEERKFIESNVRGHGGEYHPDLSRQCTHLICASSEGKKYEAALKWNIACVGVEWLFQSIERGMALEAKYFTLDIEPANRGKDAWDRMAAMKTSQMPFPAATTTDGDAAPRKRRLRRAGSKAQEGLWEGILGGVSETEIVRSAGAIDIQNSIVEESAMDSNSMEIDDPIRGLFDGIVFYIWGFSDTKRDILANVITKNAGLVFTKPLPGGSDRGQRSFTIIPHSIPAEEVPAAHAGSDLVTDMWIERCIAVNIVVDPEALVMSKPMPGPFPRPYLKNIAISITGFSGPDLLHVERLITLVGADFYSNLTRKRSLLLTPSVTTTGPKITKAREWRIPVVSVGWLWETIARGDEEVELSGWSENPVVELVRYTPDEAAGGSSAASCALPAKNAGKGESRSAPTDTRREKRMRQNENVPPVETNMESVKLEHITKFLGTVSSPQKKSRRKLAGRARNTPLSTTTSSVLSPDDASRRSDEEELPKPTQEKVEYKDPIAEREMAKIVANLQGISEDGKNMQQNNGMTPAEDLGQRARSRRKSTRNNQDFGMA